MSTATIILFPTRTLRFDSVPSVLVRGTVPLERDLRRIPELGRAIDPVQPILSRTTVPGNDHRPGSPELTLQTIRRGAWKDTLSMRRAGVPSNSPVSNRSLRPHLVGAIRDRSLTIRD